MLHGKRIESLNYINSCGLRHNKISSSIPHYKSSFYGVKVRNTIFYEVTL